MSPDLAQLAKKLLADLPWSIVLPAGCGKTELIAAIAATIEHEQKPLLVLTHTNAGVDVVRKRFAKYGVKSDQARVFTLDTWAKLFDDHFPLLGSTATVPIEANLWLGIRLRAKAILKNKHIGEIIAATYSAVIVDEYQDCSDLQHELVTAMNQYLPIGVVGDPLQGIFDFGEGVVDWATVSATFAPKELTPIPHRWTSKNPILGTWLIDLRSKLKVGTTIDLLAVDTPITWKQSTMDLSDERRYCLAAATTAGDQKQVVILRQLPEQCHKFARSLFGRFSVAEEIELKVALKLMSAMDEENGAKTAAATLEFIRSCCTGYPSVFSPALVTEYSRGNAHSYQARNSNSGALEILNTILSEPTAQNVKNALNLLKNSVERVYRREAWYVVMQVLDEAICSSDKLIKKLQDVRNRSRYGGIRGNRHIISRTLLVKGQEYDECIILGADGMSVRNLYVALSRGVDKVTVFSNSPILKINTF